MKFHYGNVVIVIIKKSIYTFTISIIYLWENKAYYDYRIDTFCYIKLQIFLKGQCNKFFEDKVYQEHLTLTNNYK